MCLEVSGTVGECTLTVDQLASHYHYLRRPLAAAYGEGNGMPGGTNIGGQESTENAGGSLSHAHDFTGSTATSNSLPPYYVLAYIMRVS